GAFGHDAARVQTNGLPGFQWRGDVAGKALLLNREPRMIVVVCMADGIAVHGAVVGRWQIQRGDDGFGCDAPGAVGKAGGFRFLLWLASGNQVFLGGIEIKHGSRWLVLMFRRKYRKTHCIRAVVSSQSCMAFSGCPAAAG